MGTGSSGGGALKNRAACGEIGFAFQFDLFGEELHGHGFHDRAGGAATIVTFELASLMKQNELERISIQLSNVIEAGTHRLVLDFRKVDFISSQAIGMLVATHKKMEQLKTGRLALCGLSDKLLQLLKITRLDKVLVIRGSRGDALAAVSS